MRRDTESPVQRDDLPSRSGGAIPPVTPHHHHEPTEDAAAANVGGDAMTSKELFRPRNDSPLSASTATTASASCTSDSSPASIDRLDDDVPFEDEDVPY